MRTPTLFLAALGLWASTWARAEDARPEVLWYLANFPPSSIHAGALKGHGYLDRILDQVIWPALPQFRHRLVVAPPSRLVQDSTTLPNVCTPSVAKTPERLAAFHVSTPLFRFLPSGLVVRRSDVAGLQPWLTPTGEVDFERLLADRAHVIGVVGTRRHGAAIDRALTLSSDRLLVLNTTQANTTLLRMLALQRSVDGALAYGFEIPFLESQFPELAGQLTWLPVRGQPSSLTNHVACSKSELGARIVRHLDEHLRTSAGRQVAQRLFEDWLDPASRQALDRLRREMLPPETFWLDAMP